MTDNTQALVEDLGLCIGCNKPLRVGEVVTPWADEVGHYDCRRPACLNRIPELDSDKDTPPPMVLLGSPARYVPLEAIAAWNTRASAPPVGETSALVEKLTAMANGLRGSMWANRNEIIGLLDDAAAALRKPAEPVGDEVERVARAIAAASYIDLSVAIGEAGGITNAVAEFGMDAISDDPRYRKWRLPSCRGVILAARAAITALSSTPERGWHPIETAPHACHVIAARFDRDAGEWIYGFVLSPPSKPFTHWRMPPEPPALTKGSTDE